MSNAVKPRILVVDDEPQVREVVRAILETAHYDIDEVCDGTEVLSRVSAWHPHMVITDLVMPEGEGMGVIRQLRQTHPALGIIAMSGARGGSYLPVARAMGADATITKPFDPATLLRQVQHVLDLRPI